MVSAEVKQCFMSSLEHFWPDLCFLSSLEHSDQIHRMFCPKLLYFLKKCTKSSKIRSRVLYPLKTSCHLVNIKNKIYICTKSLDNSWQYMFSHIVTVRAFWLTIILFFIVLELCLELKKKKRKKELVNPWQMAWPILQSFWYQILFDNIA